MRALLQRVTEASVSVDGKVIGKTGPGFMILACAMQGDTEANVTAIAKKITAYIAHLKTHLAKVDDAYR